MAEPNVVTKYKDSKEYKRLVSLNDLMERTLSKIDTHSEHLLYQDERFLEIYRQIQDTYNIVLKKKAEEADVEPEEEFVRVGKLSSFFQYVQATKDSMDALNNLDNDNEMQPVERDLIAIANMLKLKKVVAEMQERVEKKKSFVDAIDSDSMAKIFIDNSQDVVDAFDGKQFTVAKDLLLGNVNGNAFPGQNIEVLKKSVRQALQKGVIQQSIPIVAKHEAGRECEYTAVQIDKPTDAVKSLLETNRIKEVIKQYRNAETFWMSSDLTAPEEKESRRAFMETYAEDLDGLYRALNLKNANPYTDTRDKMLDFLEKNEIDGMMRDYHDMMLDREEERKEALEGKAPLEDGKYPDRWTGASDDGTGKDPWGYLYSSESRISNAERAFRNMHTRSNTYDAKGDSKATDAQKLGLKEFQKWIYRNCDSVGFDMFGSNGSARSYLDDFIKAPYDMQIKTLYMLETKTRKSIKDPDEKDIENYVPNLDKLKDVMVSSKFRFWQRLNGKKHRWNKIKDCMDRLKGKGIAKEHGLDDSLKKASTVLETGKAATAQGSQAVEKLLDQSHATKAVGALSGAQGLISGVYNTVKNIIKLKGAVAGEEGSVFTTTLDTIQTATGAIASGATVYNYADRLINGNLFDAEATTASTIAMNGNFIVNCMKAIRRGGAAIRTWFRNSKRGAEFKEATEGMENYDSIPDDNPHKKLLGKLQKHSKAINDINLQRVRTYAIESAQGGLGATTGLLSGACGLMTPVAGTITGVLGGIGFAAIPAVIFTNNKLEVLDNRQTIDNEIYANDAEKKKALDGMRDLLANRKERLNGKRKNLEKALDKFSKNEKSMLNHIRRNVARKHGCVNEKQLKGVLLEGVKKDLHDMHYMTVGLEHSPENSKFLEQVKTGADALIKQAGGVVPTSVEKPKDDEALTKEIQELGRGL